MDTRLTALHRRNNRETAEGWQPFAEHRARVTGLLLPGARRLAVLGAGNCNELDLTALGDAYREIHLADPDGARAAGGPVDASDAPRDPWAVVRRLQAATACFAGTSPRMIERMLRDDVSIACLIEPPARLDPWLWRLSPERTFLVCGITMR